MEKWRSSLIRRTLGQITLRSLEEGAVDSGYGVGAGITKMVPLSRTLQEGFCQAKEGGVFILWEREAHKQTMYRSKCCLPGS